MTPSTLHRRQLERERLGHQRGAFNGLLVCLGSLAAAGVIVVWFSQPHPIGSTGWCLALGGLAATGMVRWAVNRGRADRIGKLIDQQPGGTV